MAIGHRAVWFIFEQTHVQGLGRLCSAPEALLHVYRPEQW